MKGKTIFIFSMMIALTLSGLNTWYRSEAIRYLNVQFEISIETPVEKPILQIFYNIGNGFNEKDSQGFWLTEQDSYELIFCRIPATKLSNLRFDFINGSGKATIQDVMVTSNNGQVIFKVTEDAKIDTNQIESITVQKNVISLKSTDSAFDPYFTLSFPQPLAVNAENQFWQHVLFGFKIFSIILITLTTALFLARAREKSSHEK